MSSEQKIGVIGLGSMGLGMALSLVRAGHEVWGADLDAGAVDRLQSEGGKRGDLREAAGALDAVVVVVLNSTQMAHVLFDGPDALAPHLKAGAVVIACPTIPPQDAKLFAQRAKAFSLEYLDAPISGGAGKAAEGKLTIMASGADAAFTAAEPTLAGMSEKVFRLGDSAGAGSAMKAINQLMAGTQIAIMAEAVTFGMTQGISPAQTVKVISECAGASFMLENRGPHIVDGDYAPRSAVDIWLKDLGIVLDIAKTAKFSAPMAAAALQQFIAASGSGLGREDDAAVAKVYARNAGLTLPGEADEE